MENKTLVQTERRWTTLPNGKKNGSKQLHVMLMEKS